MSVSIRLQRMGNTHRPFYNIVAADKRSPRDGKFLERLGYYNPLAKQLELKIDIVQWDKWVKNGAQPTDKAESLYKIFKKQVASATV
jgi:small subunit ribosomal protein S16